MPKYKPIFVKVMKGNKVVVKKMLIKSTSMFNYFKKEEEKRGYKVFKI